MDYEYDLSDGPDGAPDGAVASCIGGRRRGTWIPLGIPLGSIEADKRKREEDKRKREEDKRQPLGPDGFRGWPQRIPKKEPMAAVPPKKEPMAAVPPKKEPMAAVLPNPFALKSHKNNRYLNCVNCANINKKGVLRFCEEYCYPNFRTENAQTLGCVHIKHVASGKYLKRAENQDGRPLMIVATADTPNEDTHDEGCTLFKPEDVGPNTPPVKVTCRIVHVQSRLYIRPYNVQGEDSVLCAMNADADASPMDLFSANGAFNIWYI